MSPLANYIRQRMDGKGWNQGQLARAARIRESTLSHILNKEGLPRPDTIKALANALGVEASILTALAGYPVDPASDPDARLVQIARQLEASPWLAERVDDLLRLSKEEFDEMMRYVAFRQTQQDQR